MFEEYNTICSRLLEPRRFIQILLGPRQVGKTSTILKALKNVIIESHYSTADDPGLKPPDWIEQTWLEARDRLSRSSAKELVLVLDEIQKIQNWPEVIKRLWDEDTRHNRALKVVLLGSSTLLIQAGLSESLAGRFEIIRLTHWNLPKIKSVFSGVTLDQYIYFGGYPGSIPLIDDESRWKSYLRDSIIETTISRDVLLLNTVEKPALFRNLFLLGCEYSGQVLSFQKMLGQLRDAGNAGTIAHYLRLLESSGIILGLQKYSGSKVRQRASSPKLQVCNSALLSSVHELSFNETRNHPEIWGRFVETSVGAHIVNSSFLEGFDVYYWREGELEVDFVIKHGSNVVAIEVKSGKRRRGISGMIEFKRLYTPNKSIIIGTGGVEIEAFLSSEVSELFR